MFLQLQRQSESVQQAPDDAQRIDIDGERAQLADVLDELRSFAMFGGHKMVIVRDAEDFISRFRESFREVSRRPGRLRNTAAALRTLAKTTRIYKLIDKLGGICECEPPTQLASWIMSQAKNAHGLTLSSEVTAAAGGTGRRRFRSAG